MNKKITGKIVVGEVAPPMTKKDFEAHLEKFEEQNPGKYAEKVASGEIERKLAAYK